ncbi:MAG: beta-hexosaminidase [Alphaproteobacteria bacterium]|nr:beta-hexosaminidase [Alphaproteobacteria bacterium]
MTSIAGPVLAPEEGAFLRAARPLGVILMGRNCVDRAQLRALTDSLRPLVPHILVDQEGGRVQRLKPPQWPQYRPAAGMTIEEAVAQAGRIAADLVAAGIDVNCAPVLDVPEPGAHQVIGDRAFTGDVAAYARAVCAAYLAAGVTPVAKHIPGHGRARTDSHHDLPVVDASRAELEADLAPFRGLPEGTWAMTAHVVYTALDPAHPASTSRPVISAIRADIGFAGVLLSDDVEMAALAQYGDAPARARACLDAGCDVALYCGGDVAVARVIAAAIHR